MGHDISSLLKDIDPKLLESEQFQRLKESIRVIRTVVDVTEKPSEHSRRTLTPYVDAPSILDRSFIWK
jgi:hypothetical protein